jgi:hypothetical protein
MWGKSKRCDTYLDCAVSSWVDGVGGRSSPKRALTVWGREPQERQHDQLELLHTERLWLGLFRVSRSRKERGLLSAKPSWETCAPSPQCRAVVGTCPSLFGLARCPGVQEALLLRLTPPAPSLKTNADKKGHDDEQPSSRPPRRRVFKCRSLECWASVHGGAMVALPFGAVEVTVFESSRLRQAVAR